MSEQLIQRLRKQRESSLELQPGVSITIRRPTEYEMTELLGGITEQHLKKHVVGWAGVTEALLMGADMAPPDAVAFHADLWAEVVADRSEWFKAAADELKRITQAYLEAKAETRKN